MSISNFNNLSLLASPELRADDRQNCCNSYNAFSNRLVTTDFFLNAATLVKHLVCVILDYTPLVGLICQVVREALFGVNNVTASATADVKREITIKSPDGVSFAVQVSPEGAVADLRAAVAKNQDLASYRIELFIFGTEDKLQDTLRLSSPDIQAVTEVFMLIKPEINEKEALIALYNACGGATWTYSPNWNTAAPLSEWHGVIVENDRVTRLVLEDSNLTGTLPSEIGALTALEVLGLNHNQLSGAIPPEIGKLTALRYLGLHYNQLSGAIPPQIGTLTALTELYLSHNQLSGAIPQEIGDLTALTKLYLHNNQLSGVIPSGIGGVTALEDLILSNNQLSGAIPQEMGDLTALTKLYLHNNQLSGAIPPQIGALTALERLDLFSNQLSGVIPPEIGDLTALTQLWLYNNQLSGAIPQEVRALGAFHEGTVVPGNRLTLT